MSANLRGTRPSQRPPDAGAATARQTGQPRNGTAREGRRPSDDEMRQLLEDLAKASEGLGDRDLGLQAAIAGLILSMEANPGLVQRPDFRRRVAFALQDMERAIGRQFLLTEPVRIEMHRLATTMPGLENATTIKLLSATPFMQDQGFVSLIRKAAQGLAAGDRPSSSALQGIVDGLASRYGLQAPSIPHDATTATIVPQPAASSQQSVAVPGDGSGPATQTPPPAHETRPEATRRVIRQRGGAPLPQATGTEAGKIDNAMLRPIPTDPDVVLPLPAGLTKERISLFDARLAERKTHCLLEDAEKSGARAIEAAGQFIQGPGRDLFDKLESAGRTEFDGIAAVVKGMYPGGPHAGLRAEFDDAYQQDEAFRAAHERMVDGVARFGEDRDVVAKNYQNRHLNPATLDDRFRAADDALQRLLSRIPGRQPGKSARDEVTAKVAEILRAAFDRLVSMFHRKRDAAPWR